MSLNREWKKKFAADPTRQNQCITRQMSDLRRRQKKMESNKIMKELREKQELEGLFVPKTNNNSSRRS
jgi:cell division protein YceG involved in septum cleavage